MKNGNNEDEERRRRAQELDDIMRQVSEAMQAGPNGKDEDSGDDAPDDASEDDVTPEEVKEIERRVDEIAHLCRKSGISLIVGYSYHSDENESGVTGVQAVHTDTLTCELAAATMVFEMAHEFSHAVLALAASNAFEGRRGEDSGNEQHD